MLFFLTLLVYTVPHIMVFGAVINQNISNISFKFKLSLLEKYCEAGMSLYLFISCLLKEFNV